MNTHLTKLRTARVTALGFALTVCLAAPVAMAEPSKDHPDAHADAHPAAPHAEAHAAPARPAVTHRAEPARSTTVHRNVVVNRTENVHRNVVVNRTEVAHQVVGGAPHVGHWSHGDRFTGSRVVFNDWGRYHLRQPPPGYAWVQDGDQLVLIDLGSGLIDDTFIITVP